MTQVVKKKIDNCPECGEPKPTYAERCFNCGLEADSNECGLCDITFKLCPECGLCGVTYNTFKPLPDITSENWKEKLKEAEEFCWLANYAQHTQKKSRGMATNGIPNWQCIHFHRDTMSALNVKEESEK